MKLRLLAVGIAAMSIMGCKVESNSKTETASFNYDFTDNGCKTNKQSAPSVDGICRKLEDHALNNYCAYGMRAEEFKRYNCFTVLGNRPSATAEANVENGGGDVSVNAYQYNQDGCDTGLHMYKSKREYCAVLVNDRLNNNCANEWRRNLWTDEGCASL